MSLRPSMALVFCLVIAACVMEITSGTCVDKDPNCATYVKGHCTFNKPWGMKMCKKFCNYCDCTYHGKTYKHGEKFDYECESNTCENGGVAGTGRSCQFFDLPDPKCAWYRPDDRCCDIPFCPPGFKLTFPSWWANYEKYMTRTKA